MSEEGADVPVVGDGKHADVEMEDDPSVQRKGRGFDPRNDGKGHSADGVKHRGKFDNLDIKSEQDLIQDDAKDDHIARSVEGYIVIVTGIDEEATEEEVTEKFSDFGKVITCHLNLDRRTGYVKGYALLEYQQLNEARQAIIACNEKELTLMDKTLQADFAFVQPPQMPTWSDGGDNRSTRGVNARHRSRSPTSRR